MARLGELQRIWQGRNVSIDSVGSMGCEQDQMVEARLNVLSCTVRDFTLYSKRDLDLT